MDYITLSFVIPAYNAEKYIQSCIESILQIDRDDYEVLVVDDGSTDKTAIFVSAIKSKKVRLITIENSGVSTARNTGIFHAKGKYVAFVDADDKVSATSYEKLWVLMQDEYECIMFAYEKISLDKKEIIYPPFSEGIHSKQELKSMESMLLDFKYAENQKNNYLGGKVYQYIISKKFLNEYNIGFPRELVYAEDLCFVLEMIRNLQEIYISHEIAYQYFLNPGSAMRHYNQNFWHNWKKVIGFINKRYENEYELDKLILCNAYGSINHFLEYLSLKNINEIHRQINKVVTDPIVLESMNKLNNASWTKKEQLRNWMIKKRYAWLLVLDDLCFRIMRKISRNIKERK